MRTANRDQPTDLAELAHRAMLDRGLLPEFPPAVEEEVARLKPAAMAADILDLRGKPWCSIDNDDSRDLDQLSYSERLPGLIRVHGAVADVHCLPPAGSASDRHAAHNTTSIYTPARIFPMLAERLSTDLTSLNQDQDRLAMVARFDVDPRGRIVASDLFRARVHNRAKLTYHMVGAWLEGTGPIPPKAAADPDLPTQLKDQDEAAQALRGQRQERGALVLESIEARAVMQGGKPVDLRREAKNRAKELIEDLMIAANGVAARFLAKHGFAAIRRVVRVPERWDRIVELAARHGGHLPVAPDPKALEAFLVARRAADPLRFPDLSLAVVKLMGKGEYVLERPGDQIGHFGLAVRDYTHSTAPNRRYPDLITQRLLKAALAGKPSPYDDATLSELAGHCSEQENAADKVERQVRKSAAALVLVNRIGERFEALVTGAANKGTWVRVLAPPVEGKVTRGARGLDVGDLVRVELLAVDVEAGFIDFGVV